MKISSCIIKTTMGQYDLACVVGSLKQKEVEAGGLTQSCWIRNNFLNYFFQKVLKHRRLGTKMLTFHIHQKQLCLYSFLCKGRKAVTCYGLSFKTL